MIGLKASLNIQKSIPLMLDEYFRDYLYQNTSKLLNKIDQYGIEYRNEFNLTPLMAAAYVGKKHYIDLLISLGASVKEIDNNQRNAFMIALSRAMDDNKYCNSMFPDIYEQLKPNAIILKINNKLVKIEPYKTEYLFLYIMIIRTGNFNPNKGKQEKLFFRAKAINSLISDFPESMIPKYRKKQEHISSMLARNEINSNYLYNKQLFLRVSLGSYIINPDIEIKICDVWTKL